MTTLGALVAASAQSLQNMGPGASLLGPGANMPMGPVAPIPGPST